MLHKVSTACYVRPVATAIMDVMGADDDLRVRLGQLVGERRRSISLSISAAARAAGIDRGTWTGLEKGLRETEEYNYSRIERVLGWQPGSIDQIMSGAEPSLSQPAEPVDEAAELAANLDEIANDIRLIEQADLPLSVKRAMIREAERLRDRQLRERLSLAERQAVERREQVETWLRLAGGSNGTPNLAR